MTVSLTRFTGAGGLGLVADVGGDPTGPPVILQHGGGQTRHSWNGAMQKLVSLGYHVINLDARGHGDSQWADNGDYALDTLAEDLERVMVTLRAKPALVGASMGGMSALIVAGSRCRTMISALVLVDVVPNVDPVGNDRVRNFMRSHTKGFATLEDAAAAVNAYNPKQRSGTATGLMKNLRRAADGRLYWHWDPRLLVGLDGLEQNVPVAKLRQAAKRTEVPTLLVRGLASDVVSDQGVRELREDIPHLEVFDVAGAGHMVTGHRNDAFNEALVAFLERHRASI